MILSDINMPVMDGLEFLKNLAGVEAAKGVARHHDYHRRQRGSRLSRLCPLAGQRLSPQTFHTRTSQRKSRAPPGRWPMSSFTKAARQPLSPSTPVGRPSWNALAIEVFEMMASVRPELNSASTGEPTGEVTAMVGLAGALCGMTTLRCTKTTAARFAALMLGEAAASDPSSSGDALGELQYGRGQF